MDTKQDRYVLLFGGIISLVFGILLFTRTDASLALIMLLVGLLWFIQGIFTLLGIFIDKSSWGWKLFGGVIGVAAGMLVLQNPLASTEVVPAVLAVILGIFGVLIGITALIGSVQGRRLGSRHLWCRQPRNRFTDDVQFSGFGRGAGVAGCPVTGDPGHHRRSYGLV